MPRFPTLIAGLVAVLCLFTSAFAKTEWLHARSAHFELYGTCDQRTATDTLRHLEDIRAVYRVLFTRAPRYEPRMLVIHCASEKDMAPFMKKYAGRTVEMAAFHIGPASYPAIVLNPSVTDGDPLPLVYHEMGHSFVQSLVPSVPLFINEGIAQVFESVKVGKEGFECGKASPERVSLLRHDKLLPLRELFAVDPTSSLYKLGRRRGLFYSQSWAFAHMCLFGADRTLGPKLLEFVTRQAGEADPAACMERVFGMKLDELDRLLANYVKEGRYDLCRNSFTEARETATNFLPLVGNELECVRLGLLQRVHQSEGAKEYVMPAYRKFADPNDANREPVIAAYGQLVDSNNAWLCVNASLHASDLGEPELAAKLCERAMVLKAEHPGLYADLVSRETRTLARTVTYRMPEDVAALLRGLIDRGLQLDPGNLDLLRQLAYVEAFAPNLRMDKLPLLETSIECFREKEEMLVLLAYIRWRHNDATTARVLVEVLKKSTRSYPGEEMVAELDHYLSNNLPWKKVL